jgi:hypothetical protein
MVAFSQWLRRRSSQGGAALGGRPEIVESEKGRIPMPVTNGSPSSDDSGIDTSKRQPMQEVSPWRNPPLLAAVAALFAAIIPLTAAINGWFSLALERDKFRSEMRLKYVDRALDPTKDPAYKSAFLDYLVGTTSPTDPMHKWARTHMQYISDLEQVRTQLTQVNAKLLVMTTQARELSARDQKAFAVSEKVREKALRTEIVALRSEKVTLQQRLNLAEVRIGYPVSRPLENSTRPLENSTMPVEDLTDPIITSAEISGRMGRLGRMDPHPDNIRILGRHFGTEPGYVVQDYGGRTSDPLKVISWSDSEIWVVNPLPLGWSGEPPKQIVLTTHDLRYSRPADIVPYLSY